jgi:hypothetical protein
MKHTPDYKKPRIRREYLAKSTFHDGYAAATSILDFGNDRARSLQTILRPLWEASRDAGGDENMALGEAITVTRLFFAV